MPLSIPLMLDVLTWLQTPLHERRTMSRTDYRETYNADKADLEVVVAVFKAQGMTVVRSEAVTRSVEVSGSATQINLTFAMTLDHYTAPLGYLANTSARTDDLHPSWYDGVIHIPAHLSDIVVGVVGLDNRPLGTPSVGPGNDPIGPPTSPAILLRISPLFKFE
jgi:kumamolisin